MNKFLQMSYFWYWHYLFLSMYITYVCAHAQLLSRVQLCNPMDCSQSGSSVQGYFSGKNTGVGCHFFLQGIFLIQRSNSCFLLSCVSCIGRRILYRWATGETCIYIYVYICTCICIYVCMLSRFSHVRLCVTP